jgi:hypothetical protein
MSRKRIRESVPRLRYLLLVFKVGRVILVKAVNEAMSHSSKKSESNMFHSVVYNTYPKK